MTSYQTRVTIGDVTDDGPYASHTYYWCEWIGIEDAGDGVLHVLMRGVYTINGAGLREPTEVDLVTDQPVFVERIKEEG